MALAKIEDFYPNYKNELFDGEDIKGIDVYSELNDEKIGSVTDVLLDDDSGQIRYFVVDTGFWVFGKKILLPVGRSRVDANQQRIYAVGLTKEQAENLPEFNELERVDYDYEDQVRGVYSPTTAAQTDYAVSDRNSYDYEREPNLYATNQQDHQNIKLYEERLIANKQRRKTGEVAVGKHVETETARVSVPVEKERVIVERSTPVDTGRAVAPGEANFREGEIAHMDIYEESADVHKEAYVREEVNVRKEVDRETVNAQETIRREELDIDSGNNPIVDKSPNR